MSESNAFAESLAKIDALPDDHPVKAINAKQTAALAAYAKRPLTPDEQGIIAAQTVAGVMMTRAMQDHDIDLASDAFAFLTATMALMVMETIDSPTNAPAETPDDALLTALWARTEARDN